MASSWTAEEDAVPTVRSRCCLADASVCGAKQAHNSTQGRRSVRGQGARGRPRRRKGLRTCAAAPAPEVTESRPLSVGRSRTGLSQAVSGLTADARRGSHRRGPWLSEAGAGVLWVVAAERAESGRRAQARGAFGPRRSARAGSPWF